MVGHNFKMGLEKKKRHEANRRQTQDEGVVKRAKAWKFIQENKFLTTAARLATFEESPEFQSICNVPIAELAGAGFILSHRSA